MPKPPDRLRRCCPADACPRGRRGGALHVAGLEAFRATRCPVDTWIAHCALGLNHSRADTESIRPKSKSQRCSSGSRPLNTEPSIVHGPRSIAAVDDAERDVRRVEQMMRQRRNRVVECRGAVHERRGRAPARPRPALMVRGPPADRHAPGRRRPIKRSCGCWRSMTGVPRRSRRSETAHGSRRCRPSRIQAEHAASASGCRASLARPIPIHQFGATNSSPPRSLPWWLNIDEDAAVLHPLPALAGSCSFRVIVFLCDGDLRHRESAVHAARRNETS